MENKKKLWIKLFFAFAWCQFIVLAGIASYLLLAPYPGETFESYWDKLLHVVCWFVLLGSLKLPCIFNEKFWRFAIALFLYSLALEIAQHFLPPRAFNWWDVFSNGLGILIAYLMALLFDRWFRPFLLPFFRP